MLGVRRPVFIAMFACLLVGVLVALERYTAR